VREEQRGRGGGLLSTNRINNQRVIGVCVLCLKVVVGGVVAAINHHVNEKCAGTLYINARRNVSQLHTQRRTTRKPNQPTSMEHPCLSVSPLSVAVCARVHCCMRRLCRTFCTHAHLCVLRRHTTRSTGQILLEKPRALPQQKPAKVEAYNTPGARVRVRV